MGAMMLVGWLPLILVLVWALKMLPGSDDDREEEPRSRYREPDAGEIARRAYARGDIDRERFLQTLDDLGEKVRDRGS